MNSFKLLSILLMYPTTDYQQAIAEEIMPLLSEQNLVWRKKLAPFFNYLIETDLITLQENYVATFDRNPSQSLHMFEHLHGENRDRGSALVNLLQEYQKAGFEPQGYELPDYLPLFLEFLSLQDQETACNLLDEAVHVIHYIGQQIAKNSQDSTNDQGQYAVIFELITSLSTVQPEDLKVAPIRDMDEALEVFGPTIEGLEPLLKPTDVQIVHQIRNSQPRHKAGE